MARQLTTPDRVVLLLSLVPYLTEHGPTPVGELAEAFDVDARLLRRLISFLGTAGVPGETQTYQDEDLFDIDWEAFEAEDVVSLTRVVAVDDTPRFSAFESAALIAGLHALQPMLPEADRALAAETAEKLRAAGPEAGGAEPVSVSVEAEAPVLGLIAGAISARKRLEFGYVDARGARTARRVEPLVLGQSGGGWYLRAHCLDRGETRTFAVDRMRETRMPGETFEARPAGAAGAGWGRVFGHEASRDGVVARLRMRGSALPRLAGFAPRVVEEAEPGWVVAEVDLAHPGVATRLVQSAPGEVIVEAPEDARNAVRVWVDLALAQYDA